MLNGDVVFGIITSLIGVWWIYMSKGFPGGTTDGVPGPGYFPTIIGVCLIVMSIILISKGLKNKKVYFNVKEWPKENKKIFLATIAVVMLFMALWINLSYIIACFILLFSLGYLYKVKLTKNIILSVCLTIGTYFIFNNVFNVMLNLR
ncbi:tripartite tricarboxylate transporter TctB family protein [uncultured Clostridium sp.]|uniref:tripartite tricarboxylate transporter TctB family protein n=1 Tax=uncultured Clostridium sp. TaxID=59620 RepID=UPI0028EDED0E|nr:tripartite tricarboxylate transporter TctB family protein [uncultured Clostridium sp.]